jgi:hypothetical protein
MNEQIHIQDLERISPGAFYKHIHEVASSRTSDKDLPIRRDYKDVLIYRQVLAIAAPHIKTNGPWCQPFEEAFHNRPWLLDR